MKKLSTLILVLSIGLMGFGQAVVDNAIIPMSVNINSILRLNVTSGGAVEFNVSTMNHFNYGIANSSRYTTRFTVASSIDYDVIMYAEDDAMYGTDVSAVGALPPSYTSTTKLPLDLVGYQVVSNGGADVSATGNVSLVGGTVSPSALTLLNNTTTQEVITSIPTTGGGLGGAGGTDQNDFSIQWELGTTAVMTARTATTASLLQESLAPDRYTTNIFLTLVAH